MKRIAIAFSPVFIFNRYTGMFFVGILINHSKRCIIQQSMQCIATKQKLVKYIIAFIKMIRGY